MGTEGKKRRAGRGHTSILIRYILRVVRVSPNNFCSEAYHVSVKINK